jgi:hypothetical protein
MSSALHVISHHMTRTPCSPHHTIKATSNIAKFIIKTKSIHYLKSNGYQNALGGLLGILGLGNGGLNLFDPSPSSYS